MRNRAVLFLAFVAALGGILFGYDTAVISGTISAVADRFGLDAMSKGWYVGCALVGSIGGVAVAGWLSDRFGRKPTMLFSSHTSKLSRWRISLISGQPIKKKLSKFKVIL